MNILVIGCGKVGSRLASLLSREGHDVSVIDRDARSFELLENDFSGFTIAGVPIDQDVLRRGGIESCDALAAVTQDDNVNIMVSQLAGEIFHVPIVLARIYDPKREGVFSHFGLRTICPTNMTVSAVKAAITESSDHKYMTIGSSTISFTTIPVSRQLVGRRLSAAVTVGEEVIFGVMHEDGNVTLKGTKDIVLKESDKIMLAERID